MTNSLRPGESRRAHAPVADVLSPHPMPGGAALSHVIAVREVCPAGAAYTPPPLASLTLFLTLHGRAELRVGPQSFTHEPGALVAVASGSVLAERVGAEQPWHVCYLLLSGPWADGMDAWLKRRPAPVLACGPAPPARRHGFSEMVDLALTQPEGWPWPFLSRCADLLGGLYAEGSSPGETLASQIARLLDAAPGEMPTVPQAAARLGLTPRRLIYLFEKETGEAPAQWMRKRRIAAARRLLDQGQSVTAVADRLGYASPYHFSRAFKSVTGVAPSRVREAALHSRLHV